MTRLLLILTLAICSAQANAYNWPWQDIPEQRLDYCSGFILSGLSSTAVQGSSRTHLWLAWNHILSLKTIGQTESQDEFDAGHGQFTDQLSVADAETIMEQADSSCGLGRSGLQVTGW
jgi:hypothetical protein